LGLDGGGLGDHVGSGTKGVGVTSAVGEGVAVPVGLDESGDWLDPPHATNAETVTMARKIAGRRIGKPPSFGRIIAPL
jgi:hypothetical protein